MRRTRILTAVLALAAGLLAGSPPALVADGTAQVTLAADTYTWKNARIDGGGFVPGIVFNRSEIRRDEPEHGGPRGQPGLGPTSRSRPTTAPTGSRGRTLRE